MLTELVEHRHRLEMSAIGVMKSKKR